MFTDKLQQSPATTTEMQALRRQSYTPRECRCVLCRSDISRPDARIPPLTLKSSFVGHSQSRWHSDASENLNIENLPIDNLHPIIFIPRECKCTMCRSDISQIDTRIPTLAKNGKFILHNQGQCRSYDNKNLGPIPREGRCKCCRSNIFQPDASVPRLTWKETFVRHSQRKSHFDAHSPAVDNVGLLPRDSRCILCKCDIQRLDAAVPALWSHKSNRPFRDHLGITKAHVDNVAAPTNALHRNVIGNVGPIPRKCRYILCKPDIERPDTCLPKIRSNKDFFRHSKSAQMHADISADPTVSLNQRPNAAPRTSKTTKIHTNIVGTRALPLHQPGSTPHEYRCTLCKSNLKRPDATPLALRTNGPFTNHTRGPKIYADLAVGPPFVLLPR